MSDNRQRKDNGEKFKEAKEKPEFEQRLVDIARVSRTTTGGKRLRFRACVVIGDLNGRIGWGLAKGADVAIAIEKAVNHAKKQLIKVDVSKNTIAHELTYKFKSAKIFLKPSPEGRGIIAGGVIRDVLELAGFKDVISKMYGASNKVNNVIAVFHALSNLKKLDEKKVDESIDVKPATDNKDIKTEDK
ncbi:MAG: 30S ribosomal protein S5 [Patescibacteria group bacterium]|nr:30S ribosomal protein S5 [Patescibacteria group bacterium]